VWWAVQGSNLRPLPCEDSGMPYKHLPQRSQMDPWTSNLSNVISNLTIHKQNAHCLRISVIPDSSRHFPFGCGANLAQPVLRHKVASHAGGCAELLALPRKAQESLALGRAVANRRADASHADQILHRCQDSLTLTAKNLVGKEFHSNFRIIDLNRPNLWKN
jgi:hypothetical protein